MRGDGDDAPPLEAMLTTEEVCRWLKVSRRQLYRLNLPTMWLGKRSPRYHVGTIIDFLKRRAA